MTRTLISRLAASAIICISEPAFATAVRIDFTQVPGPGGGPASQGNIAGRIVGVSHPEAFKVVIYAHTNQWYVQPMVAAPLTDVDSSGSWSNWTQLGLRYAVLLVRPGFRAPARIQMLPAVGQDVLASGETPPSTSQR
jgi:hypothetical protein